MNLLTLWLLAWPITPLYSQRPDVRFTADGQRFVVDTNLTCRSKPDFSPETSFSIPLGTQITVDREANVDGVTWYFSTSECWVYGPGTFVFHKAEPDSVLLAILDHILARKSVNLDEYVAVENYLMEDPAWRPSGGRTRASSLLQFRYLQMLDRALATNEADMWQERSLVRSWISSHGDLFAYDEVAADWYVKPRSYWQVFDSNRNAAWAQELAWFASSLPAHSDECDFACQLRWVQERQVQYWTRFPAGPHVADALARAGGQILSVAGNACDAKDAARYTFVSRKAVADIRASLSKVTHPARQELLNALAEIQRKCSK